MLIELNESLIERIKSTIQVECCGCGCCCSGNHDSGVQALEDFIQAVEIAKQSCEGKKIMNKCHNLFCIYNRENQDTGCCSYTENQVVNCPHRRMFVLLCNSVGNEIDDIEQYLREDCWEFL